MLNTLLRYLRALLILFAALAAGKGLYWLLPLGIPEGILGLLILFACLVAGIIKKEWIIPVARPITRYMPIFFLPICASIMNYGEMLKRYFSQIVLSNLISSVLSLLVIASLAQWLLNRKEAKK